MLWLQIIGRKRFLLASPEQYPYFYFYPLMHPSGRHSALDWPHAAANTERFPMAKGARMVEAILSPGEVLFIPSTWIHATEALDGPGLGMSFWSKDGGVMEITVERNATARCAAEVSAANSARAAARGRPFSSTRLKQLLYAALARMVMSVQDARSAVGGASWPWPPSASLASRLLQHTRRFSPTVCGQEPFDEYAAAAGFEPAVAAGGGWLAAGGDGGALESELGAVGCLADAATGALAVEWAEAIRPVHPRTGRPIAGTERLAGYGGVPRVAATLLEALSMGVLGKRAACPYLSELGAALEPLANAGE